MTSKIKRLWFLFKNWLFEHWASSFFKDRLYPQEYLNSVVITRQFAAAYGTKAPQILEALKGRCYDGIGAGLDRDRLITWDITFRPDMPSMPWQITGVVRVIK